MNPIGELMLADDVRLDLDVADRRQMLDEIASLLAGRHGLSKTSVLESLTVREQLGSTAVGHGFAIPHARMSQCTLPAAVFVRARSPIPFDAPDGRPVSGFIGLIVPNKANERHLQLLATAAGMLSDKAFREKLKTGSDPLAVKTLLAAWPDVAVSSSAA